MKRMRKAFIMGTMEAERAETIFLSALSRPKRRMTRKARMRRRMVMGMSTGPRATRDMRTTKASRRLHGLRRKGCSQCASMLTDSSAANTTVKKRLEASRACPSAAPPPVGIVEVADKLCLDDVGEEVLESDGRSIRCQGEGV